MPVEKTDVIDLVTTHPKTNTRALVMVETRDWNSTPGSVAQLHAKIEAYAQFILSGSLARQHPEWAKSPVCIRLEHFTPIIPEVAAALRLWAGRLSGIPVGVCSHRMYWDPLINLFHRLVARFTDSDHRLVQWLPETGASVPLLSSKQFAEAFVAALSQKVPNYQIQIVQDLQLKFIGPDGKESGGFLYNAYNHYRIAPDSKTEVIEKYLKGVLETLQKVDEPINRDRIVPVVKDKDWLREVNEAVKARGGEKEMENVHEVYNEELVIAYAEDTPNNIHYLVPADLTKLKLERKDLRKLACANLARLLPTPDIQVERGAYRIRAGGDYDASLLLLEGVWENSKLEIRGEIVVAIPARGFLVVTGSEDADGLRMVRAMAEKVAAEAPYRLSSKLFVRREGTFVSFEH